MYAVGHAESTKMSAATYLNTALISELGEDMDSFEGIAEIIMSLLENTNVSARCKPPLQRALTGIIDATCHSTAWANRRNHRVDSLHSAPFHKWPCRPLWLHDDVGLLNSIDRRVVLLRVLQRRGTVEPARALQPIRTVPHKAVGDSLLIVAREAGRTQPSTVFAGE